MSRFRRFSSFVILVLFVLGQVFALDWQGMAARSPAGEFPSGGLYAASSAFPVNSLVDLTNPATGKTIRVIILKSQSDSRLLVALSADAATGLGLPANGTASIRAAQVPLPTGFGSNYSEELRFSSDPDLFPVDRNPSANSALAKAGENKPTEVPALVSPPVVVQEQTPAVTTQTEAPVIADTVEAGTFAPPLALDPPVKVPLDVSEPLAPPVTVVPETVVPSTGNQTVTAPDTRRPAGIKSGIGDISRSSLSAGSVGEMQKPASPVAPVLVAPGPAVPVPVTGGLAQGLGSFTRSKIPLNPGDVSRPEQSLWLANSSAAARSKKGSGLAEPRVAAQEKVTGPETGVSLSPGVALPPAFVLVNPKVKAGLPEAQSPQAVEEGILFQTGSGMYGRQLTDARTRSVLRPLGVFLEGADGVESFALVTAPGMSVPGSNLPLAKAGTMEYPDGFGPAPTLPGYGQVGADGLPLARAGAAEYPDGFNPYLAAPGSGPVGADGLPLARAGAAEYPDGFNPYLAAPGSAMVGADGLPLARTGSVEYPDGFNPALAAPGSAPLGVDGLPLARTDSLEGFNPWLAAPGTGIAAGNLPEALVAGRETADGGFQRPRGSVLALDSALPQAGDPAMDSVESLAYVRSGTEPLVSSLPEAGLPKTDKPDYLGKTELTTTALTSELPLATLASESRPDVPNPAGYADTMILGPNLADPQVQVAEAGAQAGRPGSSPLAGNLVDPALPSSQAAEAGVAGTKPGESNPLAVLPGPGTKADNSPNLVAPAQSGVSGDLATVKPKDNQAPVVKADSPVAPLDPRVSSILTYLEPAKPSDAVKPVEQVKPPVQTKPVEATKPVETTKPVVSTKPVLSPEGLSPALVASLKDYEWARGNLPIVASLEKKSYYVQVGSFANPKSAGETIKGLAKGHPVVVLPESAGKAGLYKLFVGPLKEDEKGLILYWFRSKGYRDAYIREGAPN